MKPVLQVLKPVVNLSCFSQINIFGTFLTQKFHKHFSFSLLLFGTLQKHLPIPSTFYDVPIYLHESNPTYSYCCEFKTAFGCCSFKCLLKIIKNAAKHRNFCCCFWLAAWRSPYNRNPLAT